MGYKAIVAGSTGLIGQELLPMLFSDGTCKEAIALTRRETGLRHRKLREEIVEFTDLESIEGLPDCQYAFCCLGTTMKKAGSKEAFYRVDFDYVLAFGKLAKKLGCEKFLLVSAMGADKKSMVFYNQVKGEIEEALQALEFPVLHIVRPSLLLGERNESRVGEQLGQSLFKLINPIVPSNYKAVSGTAVSRYLLHLATIDMRKGVNIHPSGKIQHYA